jgi:hypothetical protein
VVNVECSNIAIYGSCYIGVHSSCWLTAVVQEDNGGQPHPRKKHKLCQSPRIPLQVKREG